MEWIVVDPASLSIPLVLAFGLVMGLLHAFEPDHIAAMGTQNTARRAADHSRGIRSIVAGSSLRGAIWGAGHTTTLVLFGMLVYAAASLINDYVFSGLEAGAGIMLLALGSSALLGRRIVWPVHRHHHTHKDGTSHTHEHGHNDAHHAHNHRSYVIGLVHGMAGSGGLIALAVSTTDIPAMMLTFIMIFGAGSALGMCAVSGLLGIPMALAGNKNSIGRYIRYVAGVLGMVVGSIIIHDVITGLNL